MGAAKIIYLSTNKAMMPYKIFKKYLNRFLSGIDKDFLSLQIKKMSSHALSVLYQDICKENQMFLHEISKELEKVLSFQSQEEHSLYVKNFEADYASYFGVPYAEGVSSGTDALVFSLLALGIGPGDEVITTPHSYIATALAIVDVGAKPVFVDIGKDFTINPHKIIDKISSKTKAIMPVHIYGNPCDMVEIMKISNKYGLVVIEDACQAHGSVLKDNKIGSWGHIGCFSFHPSKIIGGLGDGGVVITSVREIMDRINKLKEPVHNHDYVLKSRRTPSRLAPIQVPFLSIKLKHLEEIIKQKRKIASFYNKKLESVPYVSLPVENNECYNSYRNYTIKTKDRDKLMKFLYKKGVETKIFYDKPLHLRNELKFLGYEKGDFPFCEKIYEEIISLPISHALSPQDANYVVNGIKEFYNL